MNVNYGKFKKKKVNSRTVSRKIALIFEACWLLRVCVQLLKYNLPGSWGAWDAVTTNH